MQIVADEAEALADPAADQGGGNTPQRDFLHERRIAPRAFHRGDVIATAAGRSK